MALDNILTAITIAAFAGLILIMATAPSNSYYKPARTVAAGICLAVSVGCVIASIVIT